MSMIYALLNASHDLVACVTEGSIGGLFGDNVSCAANRSGLSAAEGCNPAVFKKEDRLCLFATGTPSNPALLYSGVLHSNGTSPALADFVQRFCQDCAPGSDVDVGAFIGIALGVIAGLIAACLAVCYFVPACRDRCPHMCSSLWSSKGSGAGAAPGSAPYLRYKS